MARKVLLILGPDEREKKHPLVVFFYERKKLFAPLLFLFLFFILLLHLHLFLTLSVFLLLHRCPFRGRRKKKRETKKEMEMKIKTGMFFFFFLKKKGVVDFSSEEVERTNSNFFLLLPRLCSFLANKKRTRARGASRKTINIFYAFFFIFCL